MRILKKLNRGAIVTAVVILGIVAYLIGRGIYNKSQIPEIKKVCEQYVEVEVKYSMLPEKNRTVPATISTSELSSYIETMKKDISEYYPKDFENYSIKNLEYSLKDQAKGVNVVYDYSKKVQFSKIKFDGKSAIVSLDNLTTFDGLSPETGARDKVVTTPSDTIILTNIDGKWYVTFSNLSQMNFSENGGMYNEKRFKN